MLNFVTRLFNHSRCVQCITVVIRNITIPPRKGVSLGTGVRIGIKELEFLGYPTVKTGDPTIISFESIPTCDRQTDRQTDTRTRRLHVLYIYCIANSRSSIDECNKKSYLPAICRLSRMSHLSCLCQLFFDGFRFIYI